MNYFEQLKRQFQATVYPSSKRSRWLAVLVCTLGLNLALGALELCQSSGNAALALGEVHAHAKIVAESSSIKPGKEFVLGVLFQVDPGWHIYYKDAGEAGMPTRVEWKLPSGFTAGPLLWEKPHKFIDSEITTYGYADKTIIAAKIKPPANLATGKPIKIEADLKWLTCKEICLPGQDSVSLEIPVSDSEPDQANKALFANVGFAGDVKSLPDEPHGTTGGATGPSGTTTGTASAATTGGSSTSAGTAGSPSSSGEPNMLYLLFCALAGGFVLNFMPCVLPVIAIKIMSFIEQADEEPARVRLLGLTFSAGIILSFLTLALIVIAVRAAGRTVGWGFQFTVPGFTIAMSVVVLLLALSLFGLYYISVTVGQGELDKLAQKEGFVGTFFKGVLATTLSTPCTAPLLGTALGFAFAQPDWVVAGIFFTSGLGMSLPYLLFTAFPNLMKFFPKPGVWMEKFKESMGFILMATVVWLLGVLGTQIDSEGVMWTGYFLLTVALSCWIIGRFTDLTSTTAKKIKVWSVAAVLSAAGFWAFILAQPSVGPYLLRARQLSATDDTFWTPFSRSALDKAIAEKKTIFIDFTASWCLTCKTNEKLFINTAAVKQKFEQLKVLPMKADWTNQDQEITAEMRKYNRSGVPLYVVIPAGRPNDAIVLPEFLSPNSVVDALESAGPSK